MTNSMTTQEILPLGYKPDAPKVRFGMMTNGLGPKGFQLQSLQEIARLGDQHHQPPIELLGKHIVSLTRKPIGPTAICVYSARDVVQTFVYGMYGEKEGLNSTFLVPTTKPNTYQRYTHNPSGYILVREEEGLPVVGEESLWELEIFERDSVRAINLLTGEDRVYHLGIS